MTLAKAFAYFVREAAVNLVRSWKVSFLAVATIAVSLLVGGVFLVAAGSLATVVEEARDESRIVAYLESSTSAAEVRELAERVRGMDWVARVEPVSAAEARERFVAIFPSLAEVVEGGASASALPPSLEVEPGAESTGAEEREAWLDELRALSAVSMVDDDREWLGQLSALVAVVRGVGLALGGVLLGAAVFTIASVIRLTTYLYEEEVAIMRLVGATEFYVRGPFYVAGVLQGAVGGTVATLALAGVFHLAEQRLGGSLLGRLLTSAPPSPGELAALAGLGALAGLVGAVLSLRGEALGEPPVDEA
ncbi:MAG: cell division protein FtsX [Thermoanaerobaculia bacterium]